MRMRTEAAVDSAQSPGAPPTYTAAAAAGGGAGSAEIAPFATRSARTAATGCDIPLFAPRTRACVSRRSPDERQRQRRGASTNRVPADRERANRYRPDGDGADCQARA